MTRNVWSRSGTPSYEQSFISARVLTIFRRVSRQAGVRVRNIEAGAALVAGEELVNPLEERMRKTVIFAAAAGLAIGLFGTVGANAMTNTSPAGARTASSATSRMKFTG